MKSLIRRILRRLGPRTADRVAFVLRAERDHGEVIEKLMDYERELAGLRREIDELRRDNRRMAELYDLVFERVKSDARAQRAGAPAQAPEPRN